MSIKQFDPFYVRLYALIGGLCAICLLLVGLTWFQGPRIRQATIDPNNVVSQSGQRLVLRTNQPLSNVTKEHVSVSPATPIQMTASGNTIIVQFKQRLRYATTYTVTIKTGEHTLSHSFRTPVSMLYYMEPSVAGTGDVIRKRAVSGGKEEVVYNAEEIIDFAVLTNGLVVITRNLDFTTNLIYLDFDGKKETAIQLPRPGTVARLQSAPDRQTFGFSYTPKDYDQELSSTLFVGHETTLKPKVVAGLSGKSLQVLDWKFAPDSATILAQMPDMTTLITSTSGKKSTPLGQFTGVGGFSSDSKTVILQDRDGPLLLDLATNKQSRPQPAEIGSDSFTTSTLPFHNNNYYLLNGQAFVDSTYLDYIVADYGDEQKTLHQTLRSEGIIATEISPNDQYVMVVISEPHENNIILEARIIDTATGEISTVDEAAKVHW